MILEIKQIDQYTRAIENLLVQRPYADPKLSSPQDLTERLMKKDCHGFAVIEQDQLIGIFVFLITDAESYIELLCGLSLKPDGYEQIADYLSRHYPSYQADFVYPPANTLMREMLEGKGAFFYPVQKKMILDPTLGITSPASIEKLTPKYQDGYLALHQDDGYWTGPRVLEAPERFNVFVALHQDEVVGYLDVTRNFDENMIFDLFVRPDERAKGWGRKLLYGAIVENGDHALCLTVDLDNTAALHLYQAVGFEPVAGSLLETATWNIPSQKT